MLRKSCFLAMIIGWLCSKILAGDSWYGGGSYDGYDLRSGSVPCAGLFVNNASGATNVTTTTAWLNGMLMATSTGEAAVVRVYWGTTDGGTNTEYWAHTNDFGNIAEGQSLTTNVSVTANTLYYYRFYATNEAGEGWAYAPASFLAFGPPALNTGIGALPVGALTATLNGNLTLGGSMPVYVYWGLTDGGTTNANWAGTNSLGTKSLGAFYTTVSGLSPGTLYYYRCYGTNAYGEGWSAAATFTTRAGVASFFGGPYDGYDRNDLQTPMLSLVTGTFFIFH